MCCLHTQMPFQLKSWSSQLCDVELVSKIAEYGLPALAFYESIPSTDYGVREQFADVFSVIQVLHNLVPWKRI